jgi:EmrB/QacA subfamily drug resistance transporter
MPDCAGGTTARSPGGKRSWVILGGLTFTSFFRLVGDTALSVALPSARAQLGFGLSGMQWVVNSYTLALAALLLIGGKLADTYGGRRVFLAGLSLFSIASLAAGLSPNFALLIVSRVAQGAGATLIMPATLALIVSAFPASRRAPALGIWAGVSASALALGPLVGAGLTATLGWKWLFLINVPVGVVSLILGAALLPTLERATAKTRRDILGLLTSGFGLAAVLYAVSQATWRSWTSPRLLGFFFAGMVSLGLFVAIEQRRDDPMLDPALFRRPNLAAANLVGMLSQAVMCGMFFFMSLYLQAAQGYSTLATGLIFLPLTLPLVVVAPLAGRWTHRTGPRVLVAAGMGMLALAMLALARAAAGGSLSLIVPAFLVAGAGIGLSTTPTATAALDALPESQAGLGSGVLNASRTIGLFLGIALMGALVTMGRQDGAEALPRDYSKQLSMALLVLAILAAVTAVVALFLKRPVGALDEPLPRVGPRRAESGSRV